METLIQTIGIYRQDVGIEFSYEKSAMFEIKSRKIKIMERIKLPNQESIRTLAEKKNYKYLGILEAGTIKLAEMRDKRRKD